MDFMHVNAVITFFIISIGFGYTVFWLSKAKVHDHFLVRLLELLAVGLTTFSFLGVVLGLLHIPLSIITYLIIALLGPAVSLVVNIVKGRNDPILGSMPKGTLLSETTWCVLALLVLLGLFFAVYDRGANAYPYLEDDDSWNHAQGAMYVATQHTYTIDQALRYEPTVMHGYGQYLEPYPPTYDTLMGVLRQTNDSITWTLKLFNVLLITLGLAFFYLFFREYLRSDLKALFATFILAALPSFMSHFIWNQTLAIILMPVAFYAILRAMHETDGKGWRVPAIIAVASALVTQPVVSLVFGITVLLLFLVVVLHEALSKHEGAKHENTKRARGRTGAGLLPRFPKSWSLFMVGLGGVVLSMLFWGAQLLKWGLSGIAGLEGGELQTAAASGYTIQKYALADIFLPWWMPSSFSSRVDQAVGWGVAITVLLCLAIIMLLVTARKTLHPRRDWTGLHAALWFLLMMYLVFAPSFGLRSFWTSRAWPLLAIPLAIIVTMGVFILINSFSSNRWMRLGILVVIAIAIGLTSIPQKVAVQTAQWPPGALWTAPEELSGYLQMQQLPKNTRVYPFCGGDQRALGNDMMSDPWDPDVIAMRKRGMNVTPEEVIAFLEAKRYAFITIDATCVRDNGENATVAFVNDLSGTGRFQQAIAAQGFLLIKFV